MKKSLLVLCLAATFGLGTANAAFFMPRISIPVRAPIVRPAISLAKPSINLSKAPVIVKSASPAKVAAPIIAKPIKVTPKVVTKPANFTHHPVIVTSTHKCDKKHDKNCK